MSDKLKETKQPVLVVDDDLALRTMLETVLLDEGYTVVLARNGREALEKLDEIQPSLILLDLMMPVMDGWQFLEKLKTQDKLQNLSVLLLSASRDIKNAAKQYPVVGFLPKPFELERLLDYLQRYSR
ncbi:MAG TPA: response regulator [Chloroflexia bacterium]|nr:response regulator [Chloroflexia bacterium]